MKGVFFSVLIYKIVNKESRKIYIGMTKRTALQRFKSHLYEARTYKYNMYLHNAIRKHGEHNFKIEILEECSSEIAGERERFWIKKLNSIQPNGYNEHSGGKGGCLNASPELRQKLRDAKKNYIPWNKGLTKETDERVARNGRNVSVAVKGIPKTEAHKQAIKEAKKRKAGCLLTKDNQQTLE